MSIREQLQKPAVGYSVAGAIVVIAICVFLFGPKADDDQKMLITDAWFYDLGTNKLFTAPVSSVPPIDAPSGQTVDGQPAGVQAWLAGCGNCNDPFIVFLDKFTPEGLAAKNANDEAGAAAGHVVRAADGDTWHPEDSPEGREIMAYAIRKCGSKRPMSCKPGSGPEKNK